MQIIKGKTNIDFIGKRRIAILLSTAVNIAIVVGIAGFGFNWGVDFAGGTLVEVKFSGVVTAEQVREGAVKGGLHEPQVQSIGSAEDSTFMLRMGGVTQLTAESEQLAEKAIRALPGIDITAFNTDLDNGLITFRTTGEVKVDEIKAAVVSLPSMDVFDAQPVSYRDSVIPPDVKARVVVEAGVSFGWHRLAGPWGEMVTLDRFGASAPGEMVQEKLGFTVDNVVAAVRKSMTRAMGLKKEKL